jgi:hypothetical protein
MSAPNLFDVAAERASSMPRPSTAKRGRRIAFNVTEGENVRTITPAGRDAWALSQLISAGADGCTPITHVGPRWSHYIWKLRTVHGLDVETIDEPHGGEFKGMHARYVLRTRVAFADPAAAAAHAAEARP